MLGQNEVGLILICEFMWLNNQPTCLAKPIMKTYLNVKQVMLQYECVIFSSQIHKRRDVDHTMKHELFITRILYAVCKIQFYCFIEMFAGIIILSLVVESKPFFSLAALSVSTS